MTTPPRPGQPQQVQVRFPSDKAIGDFANGLGVSATPHELVLDFLVNVNAPNMPPVVELVRRIRIPIAMAGQLMTGIARSMDGYETQFGPIHVPQPQSQQAPPAPPDAPDVS